MPPNPPPSKLPTDQQIAKMYAESEKMLQGYKGLQGKGTVTGAPPSAVGPIPTSTPDTNPFHHFITWLGSLFGNQGSRQAQAKQLSSGAAYLANGGKQRTAQVNQVIDEAGK